MQRLAAPLAAQYQHAHNKQLAIFELRYGAHTRHTERRVIALPEHGEAGENPTYIVTNLGGEAAYRYDERYCARGEAANHIKEAQLGLSADRTSCHYFAANQFRLLLSSLAYVLWEQLRALAFAGTGFAGMQTTTLCGKLLKIGAVIVRNTRRVRVTLSSAFAYRAASSTMCVCAHRDA